MAMSKCLRDAVHHDFCKVKRVAGERTVWEWRVARAGKGSGLVGWLAQVPCPSSSPLRVPTRRVRVCAAARTVVHGGADVALGTKVLGAVVLPTRKVCVRCVSSMGGADEEFECRGLR